MTITPKALSTRKSSIMHFDQQQLNRLYQYAMTLARQPADAYDLLQSSLERFLRSGNAETIKQPEAYMRRLIRNRFIDQYRYDQRWDNSSYNEEKDFPAAIDFSLQPLEELHIQQDELERIWSLISPLDRDILYHWAVLGFTTQETADALNLAKGTLLSRVHRLRKSFVSAENSEDNRHES